MKRVVLILILIFSFLGETKSQKVLRYGIVGGYNSTSLNVRGATLSSFNSFGGGIINELRFPNDWAYSGEINYYKKGSDITIDTNGNVKDGDKNLTIHTFDFPCYAKYYFTDIINLLAGLKITWAVLSAKYDGNSVKRDVNTLEMSLICGVGLNFGKIHMKVMYGYGLYGTNIYDNRDNVLPQSLKDYSFNTFRINVGFWLWKK